MGRGRAKAKQTKVARELKYYSPDTDLSSLERELHGHSPSPLPTRVAESDSDEDDDYDPGQGIGVRLLKKVVPVQDEYEGTKFFVRRAGKRVATPLLAVVVAIEAADIVFAVDSVPAVLAVSSDPFIVYTSNNFAILGLRALYFALAAVIDRFAYLKYALAVLLVFIGSKIFVADLLGLAKFPPAASLGVTFAILAAGVCWSLWKTRKVPATA